MQKRQSNMAKTRSTCRPLGCCCSGATDEAFAYLMNGPGAATSACGAFLQVAVMKFAMDKAGCDGDGEDCGKVYGMSPGALIIAMAAGGMFFAGFAMPVLGAINDFTTYRRGMGRWCTALYLAVNALQIYIVKDTWFVMWFLQCTIGITAWLGNRVCQMSYAAEITSDHLTHLPTINGRMALYYFVGITLLCVVGAGSSAALGVYDTARFMQVVAVVVGGFFLGVSWTYFPKATKPSRTREGDGWLIWAGFREIRASISRVRSTYPTLWKFYVAMMLSDSAIATYIQCLIVYINVQLKEFDIGVFLVVITLFTVVGVVFSTFVSARLGPLRSLQLSIFAIGAQMALTVLFVYRPQHSNLVPAMGAVSGFTLGWREPEQHNVHVSFIPGGEESTTTGLFFFLMIAVQWVPALGFAVVYAITDSMRSSMALLVVFIALGLGVMCTLDQAQGAKEIEGTLHLRTDKARARLSVIGAGKVAGVGVTKDTFGRRPSAPPSDEAPDEAALKTRDVELSDAT